MAHYIGSNKNVMMNFSCGHKILVDGIKDNETSSYTSKSLCRDCHYEISSQAWEFSYDTHPLVIPVESSTIQGYFEQFVKKTDIYNINFSKLRYYKDDLFEERNIRRLQPCHWIKAQKEASKLPSDLDETVKLVKEGISVASLQKKDHLIIISSHVIALLYNLQFIEDDNESEEDFKKEIEDLNFLIEKTRDVCQFVGKTYENKELIKSWGGKWDPHSKMWITLKPLPSGALEELEENNIACINFIDNAVIQVWGME